jgi:hypothetical protein
MKSIWLLTVAALLGFTPSSAQQTWDCSSEEFRVFDFWLGSWEMQDRPSGTPLGQATVQKIHGNCAIREDWFALGGGSGANIVTYHPPQKAWRMVSVTKNGGYLISHGTWENSRLIFLTDTHVLGGRSQRRRIAWQKTDNPNSVLQTWEVSFNDGKTWFTEFNGLCLRVGN